MIFILKNGEMINEISFDKTKSTTVGCEVFDDSTILECRVKDFIKVMEDDFTLTKNVLIHTQNTNRRLYRQLKNSISIRIDKKLAAKLYRIGKEFGVCMGEWTLLNVNLTITYIADMLGCKRETLSRAMKILQDKNLVKIDGKKIYIKRDELQVILNQLKNKKVPIIYLASIVRVNLTIGVFFIFIDYQIKCNI